MLARVVRAPLSPDRREEAIGLYQTLLSQLRAQPGFTGALFLTDRSTGQALSLTLWDEPTMEVDPALFRRQLAAFDPLIAGATAVELYEVSIDGLLPAPPCGKGSALDTVAEPHTARGDGSLR